MKRYFTVLDKGYRLVFRYRIPYRLFFVFDTNPAPFNFAEIPYEEFSPRFFVRKKTYLKTRSRSQQCGEPGRSKQTER